jgi:hypothetical protein
VRLFVVLCIVAVALFAWTRLPSLGPSEEQLDDLEEAIATALGPNSVSPNPRLRGVVEAVLLPGMDKNSCEWGSSTEPTDPKSWVGCWDYVAGDLRRVGNRVNARFESEGFRVSRTRTDRTIEFTALRKSETVCVDVLAPGLRTAATRRRRRSIPIRERSSWTSGWPSRAAKDKALALSFRRGRVSDHEAEVREAALAAPSHLRVSL